MSGGTPELAPPEALAICTLMGNENSKLTPLNHCDIRLKSLSQASMSCAARVMPSAGESDES